MEQLFEQINRTIAGISYERLVLNVIYFAIALLVAWLANTLTKRILLKVMENIAKKSKITWDDILIEQQVFKRLSQVIPAAIIYGSASFAFQDFFEIARWIEKVAVVYMVAIGVGVIDALLNAVLVLYRNASTETRKVPIRSVIQMLKLVSWFFGGVIILAVLLDKSPMFFIGGMGAIAAILMLVFKDAILGLVAGIQLASNRMIQLGDWVEMPSHGADGEVIDISLTTIKIQNWDKTITTVPAYAMVSESFINWRGMEESSGRRIKRSINIDVNSVTFCTDAMLQKFRKYACIADQLPKTIEEIDAHNRAIPADTTELVNGRRLTNIGIFRIYLNAYLAEHPAIETSLTHMVRQLQSTEYGIPVQIYAFSKVKEWKLYEGVQSDIFDHIFAIANEFNLNIYQRP
ncbi:MAG: mechanosensitive ion channel family protein [Fibrobacterales bacterium]